MTSVGSNHGVLVGHNSGSINITMAPESSENPPRPSCWVPFRRDPDFIARGTLLDQIRQRCAEPASRVALVGLGGVGKSQLAIEYCYCTAEWSPETWIFWVHASNNARLEQGFREIAEQVRARGWNDLQANPFELVHDWLRNEKNGPWLLVLDNADDAAILSWPASDDRTSFADHDKRTTDSGSSIPQQHLSRYLPPSRHGSVLVTSRTKHAAMQVVEDSDIIIVEPMNSLAAHALTRQKLRIERETDDDIAELATALDYMPLALVQAAAYIRERAPRCSVRQYLDDYRKSDSRKTSLLNYQAGRLRRDEAASNSVLITWQISFEHIKNTRQSAADLLSLMSFFDRQGIHETLLRYAGDIENITANNSLEDDIVMLRDYSFITVTEDANIFEIHSLVQLATRIWLESQGQLNQWREQFITRLCAELPTGNYENWEKCQALFPHARAALAQRPEAKESLKEWASLLFKAAWYAQTRGIIVEAEEMSIKSIEVRREVLGPEHLDTLTSMDNLALVLYSQGKYEEAESMHRQVLAQREKVLGPEHPNTLTSMYNLAIVLNSQGKYEEAESMQKQTLAQNEKVLGPKHPHTLSSMSNLASVLNRQGKHEEAESINRQALAQREKVLGPKHPDTLTSAYCLAHLLASRHCYKESLALYERACAGYQTILGIDHPTTHACRQHYAEAQKSASREGDSSDISTQNLEQSPSASFAQSPDDMKDIRSGKTSRLVRGLAKLRLRNTKRAT